MLRSSYLLLLAAGCMSNHQDADGTYQCMVTQIRSGSCAQPWPAGYTLGDPSFAMTLAGNSVTIPGYFQCNGDWSGSKLSCTITGASFTNPTCPGVPWVVETALATTPNNDQPLTSGQIWAGTYDPAVGGGNGFNAVCQ